MVKTEFPIVERIYAPFLTEARSRVRADDKFASLLVEGVRPAELLGFLLYFNAFGVDMTEPVEGWIRRAGEMCVAKGYEALGRALIAHARHEAGHHQMMIDDLEVLCRRWNEQYELKVDPEELRATPRPTSVQQYRDIHEDTIASASPFGQLAIETEVEGLSVVLGPLLLDACKRVLGPDVVQQMSFIADHTALDVGHTAMNLGQLEKLLEEHPEHAQILGRIGSEALHIYLNFLGDCVDRGRELAQRADAV